jgi:hypothetical protein
MREFINIIDTALTESVGLANRKPGEKFANSVGDVITFQSLNFYPESGKFPPDDSMADAIANLKTQGMNIHWTNQAAGNSAAFAIATFTGENGTAYYLGRFFREISPNRTQNNWPNSEVPGGFKYQSRVGQKEHVGYKPSEVLTQFQDNTPASILEQVEAKFGTNSALANATRIFIESDLPCTFPRGDINPDAFRDYFCEMLQPMALVLGKNVKGNAGEAAEIFFGAGSGYSDCTISFNNNTIGGLYDSLLVNPEGRQIKLSSKGKEGASASVTNLRKSVRELEAAPKGKQLLKTYANEIAILDIIERDGHFGAPLTLAMKYDMITPEESQQVMNLRNVGPQDKIIGTGKLSPRLEKLYQERKTKDPTRIIPIEHLTAALAYKVADYVNKNTKFGEAASSILNNAALVQIYTNTSATNDTITITSLEARYPAEAVTGVELDASKVYFSTGGKGNFTFTILKNGAKSSDVNPVDGVDSIEQDQAKASRQGSDVEFKRSDIAAADRSLMNPKSDREIFGRRRR